MPAGPQSLHRVAIVGASSLLGKELKQVLEDHNFPASEIILLDASPMAGTLTEAAGEPTFIRALDEDSFEHVRFAFFAGSVADAEMNWPTALRAGAAVIDLTGAIAQTGKGTVSIPSLAAVFPAHVQSPTDEHVNSELHVSLETPAIIACTIAAALRGFQPQRVALTLFPPVSERELVGVEELESQTTELLSFRKIAKHIFDAQVAFNLLSEYGEASKPQLGELRNAISRDVAAFLGSRALPPAIQLVQAPVFYGYAFSAYAEFAAPAHVEEIEKSFTRLEVKVGASDDPPPNNVSVAGEGEIQLAHIATDPGVPAGLWLWGVADNVRLAATNAVRIAEDLIAK
jgi:aspartate-semialdehyde dehydrogenase